jgi:hypothetical protein
MPISAQRGPDYPATPWVYRLVREVLVYFVVRVAIQAASWVCMFHAARSTRASPAYRDSAHLGLASGALAFALVLGVSCGGGSSSTSESYQITGVTVSPTTASIGTTQTQQFNAVVHGTGPFPRGVNWFAGGVEGGNNTVGTISADGLYSAPQNVPPGGSVAIQAVSAADNTKSATAQVTITQGGPVITQLSTSTANAGDSIQVIGSGFVGSVTVFFSGPNGIPLAALPDPSSSSPTQLNLVVPLSAAGGQVFVQVQSQGGSVQQSNSVSFTRLPRVRIRAAQHDLSAGESVFFQSRIFASQVTENLNWSVDVGSITSDGTYTAPMDLASDAFALVTACIQTTQICDQERLGLHPFRIAPNVPMTILGGTLQLSGVQDGGTIVPTWQLNGPGSITPDGLYTASSQIAGGGGAPLVATYGGISERTSIGVTGALPGIVNRVSDYIDLTQAPFPLGTFAVNVGTAGTSAYVLATDQIDFVLDQNYYWTDVYNVSDPRNPVWTDAFEPAARGQMLDCDGYLYQITGTDYSSGPPYPGIIAVYDISGPHPVMLSRQLSPVVFPVIVSQDGCLFTEVSLNEAVRPGQPLLIDQLLLQSGSVIHTQINPVVPADLQSPILNGAASNGSVLFLYVNDELVVYDLTKQPPTQIGLLTTGSGLSSALSIVGNLLFIATETIQGQFSQVFDITTPQPVLLNVLPVGPILANDGSTAIALQNGLRALDVSKPQSPAIKGTAFDYVDAQYAVALASGYALASEGEGGLAVYDLSEPGGVLPNYLSATGSNVASYPAFAQAADSSNVYFAIAAEYGSGVLGFDLSTRPPGYVGGFATGSSLCQALALNGNYLYLGATDSLRVLDVSNPASPTQVDSISTGISALAVSGTSLFAGTVDDKIIVFDVSQPSHPHREAALRIPNLPIEMVVSGNLLLVAASTAGLLVYDITIPTTPVLLSETKPSTGGVFDVAVDGNLVLLAAWDGGLVVVDLTNPYLPQVIGQAVLDTIDPFADLYSYLLNKAATIALLDKIAFVGIFNADPSDPPDNGNGMIYGFDYIDPTHPRLVYLGAYGGAIADGILTLRAVGSDLFAGGTSMLIDFDASAPRNTINLFFPPAALRPPINGAQHSVRSRQRMHTWREPIKGRLSFRIPAARKYR